MQYHNYYTLNRAIKEQYSRPVPSNENNNLNFGQGGNFNFSQGSMMSFLTEGDMGKALTNFYNVPNTDTLLQVGATTIKQSEEKSKIKDDRTKYIYIDASND